LPIGKNANLAPVHEPVPEDPKDKGPMDWNNFDFSKDESFNSANDEIAQEALDVDTFFKNIDGSEPEQESEGDSEEEVRVETEHPYSFVATSLGSFLHLSGCCQ
jgi:hypothetical protein